MSTITKLDASVRVRRSARRAALRVVQDDLKKAVSQLAVMRLHKPNVFATLPVQHSYKKALKEAELFVMLVRFNLAKLRRVAKDSSRTGDEKQRLFTASGVLE